MTYQRDNLTETQKDQLLSVLFYTMTSETRQRLMAEVPQAYNAAMGREVVRVVWNDNDKTVPAPEYFTERRANAELRR
jgi:hypothetical protein